MKTAFVCQIISSGANVLVGIQLWPDDTTNFGINFVSLPKTGIQTAQDIRDQTLPALITFLNANGYDAPQQFFWSLDPQVAMASFSAYVATISQSGTSAPSATNVKHDFGATTFAWSRTGTGVYRLTASAATFTAGKTALIMSNPPAFLTNYKYSVVSSTVIEIQSASLSVLSLLLTAGNADALLSSTLVEVRVFA